MFPFLSNSITCNLTITVFYLLSFFIYLLSLSICLLSLFIYLLSLFIYLLSLFCYLLFVSALSLFYSLYLSLFISFLSLFHFFLSPISFSGWNPFIFFSIFGLEPFYLFFISVCQEDFCAQLFLISFIWGRTASATSDRQYTSPYYFSFLFH